MRDLKTAKAEKSVIDAEVKLLLDLKKQLTAAQGGTSEQPGGKQKSSKGGKQGEKGKQSDKGKQSENKGKPASSEGAPVNGAPVDSAEVARLQALVTEQVYVTLNIVF